MKHEVISIRPCAGLKGYIEEIRGSDSISKFCTHILEKGILMNLIESLEKEVARNKDLVELYKSLGNTGVFGATAIALDIDTAEAAMRGMDTVQMIRSLTTLRNNK